MAENKIAKIPVASHGLHKHSYNYPWLSSLNFGDVMPCYYNPLRKGEKDSPKAGLYSQLMPIAHNAFATGRYDFKAIFVPFKMVWRPWYYFSEQTEFVSNGTLMTPHHYPYVDHSVLSKTLLGYSGLFSVVSSGSAIDPTVTDYDILYFDPNSGGESYVYYKASSSGARVLRILGALGVMPSFYALDTSHINILALLCYFKAFIDYYFPNNYVGNSSYRTIVSLFERDDIDYNPFIADIVFALSYCSLNFYEDCIFDLAWSNPASPNIDFSTPSFNVNDVTDTDHFLDDTVHVNGNNDGVPYMDGKGFSKYIVDALKAVSMWMKRRQLSGARLIDRFLVSRGVSLSNDSARISYFLGTRKVEIEVSGVENNTDVNLGELAGRGIASSGDKPISFDCNADDDGIFLIIVSPLPDASFPILFDGFANRQDFNDNYHAEYDKLGAAAVPNRVIRTGLDGVWNSGMIFDNGDERVFGFLNQYWDEIQERPRLLGDFILKSRGSEELSAYHTFRLFHDGVIYAASSGFVRMNDSDQYQRLFYSENQENLMLFLRWYGDQFKEKLPLGDSYDWDDDELNRKVSVVVGGSQK